MVVSGKETVAIESDNLAFKDDFPAVVHLFGHKCEAQLCVGEVGSAPQLAGNKGEYFRQEAHLRNLLCYMHRLWGIAHLLCAHFGGIWWKGCLAEAANVTWIVSRLREGWAALTPLRHSAAFKLPAAAIHCVGSSLKNEGLN